MVNIYCFFTATIVLRTRLNLTFLRLLPVVFSFILQYFQFQLVNGWKMSVIDAIPCDVHTIYKAHMNLSFAKTICILHRLTLGLLLFWLSILHYGSHVSGGSSKTWR